MPDSDHTFEADEDNEADVEESQEHTAETGSVRLRQVLAVERGTVLADRYQIEQKLGEGGSGTVYRAWDRMLGELVAIKILHPERAREKSWIRRLAREVKVARAIRHPNVCRVFELGHAGGHWFITLELATGGSLRDSRCGAPSEAAEDAGPTPARSEHLAPPSTAAGTQADGIVPPLRSLPERLDDMRALSAGLAAIHAVGITHRDVTPQNVLRMADGRVVLTDFGLAIEHGDQTTIHGGTPAYLPPEVLRGQRSDQRSDVFQLGMILHEVLYGRRPAWSADGARLLVAEPPASATTVEEELASLIVECVNTDPARRPANAVAVAGRLAAAEATRPAAPLVRSYTRVRRLARRHIRAIRVVGAALGLGVLLRAVQVASRPPLCRSGGDQLSGVWDAARAASVGRAFAAVGKSYGADTFARARATLDEYARGWVQMYTDACEATHVRGEQSAEVLDLRMGCLKQARGELKALTDLFSSPDGDVVSRAVNAVSSLHPVTQCADVAVLRAVVRPPDDEGTRARVDTLRQRIAEAKALYEAGRRQAAMGVAKPVVDEARALGYEPVLVEALYILGRSQSFAGAYADARASLDEAMLRAEACRHDRPLAEAAVEKTALLALSSSAEDLDRFVPRARATLRRVGGDLRLESWIDTSVAGGYERAGQLAEALRLNTRALEAKQRALGADHWDTALSMANVANDLHGVGRDAEALDTMDRAVATLEAALGSGHPDLAIEMSNRGEIRLALGRSAEARADFERALAIYKAEPPHPEVLSYPLTGLGLALLAGNRPSEAIAPLEQALRIREDAQTPPQLLAEAEFALARALWSNSSDRSRAVKLATDAYDHFSERQKEERRNVQQTIARWRDAATPGASVPAPSRQ